ncbi:MAG: hemerythrin domain-containing protein [Dermatophilaceae bacterium]|nr:hemerythrin domain-containing protein [Intrasporangiaceae bacterium]
MTTSIFISRPTSGDVVDLILEDHRLFEDLLRECRRTDRDRAASRQALAELLVAHAEAEEQHVYPTLRRKDAISEHEEEHGEEEHADITEALLEFLEAKGTDTQKYDDAVEKLSSVVAHHAVEEELTILNPALTEISADARAELGRTFALARNRLLDAGCASVGQVRALLERAVVEGTLAPAPAREEAEQIKSDAKAEAEEVLEGAKEQ